MRSWSIALILVIATVGLFLSNMNVVSVFKGSHYVADSSGNGNDVNCSACHKHVAEEMGITRALHGPHWDLSCEDCHRFNGSGITFATANSSGAFPGKQAHAAYVPSCLDCHGGSGVNITNVTGGISHADPARAFNVTTKVNGRNVTVISSIPYVAAHRQLVTYCEKMGNENLACLACHTNYSLNISYVYHYNLIYNVSLWNIWNFQPNWSRVYIVNYTKHSEFSGKHIFLPIKPVCMINCSKCHLNIYLGLINGTHAPIYWYNYFKWNWTSSNLWFNPRYHALGYYNPIVGYVLYNVSWINNTYCYQCHDLYLYAQLNPTANTTYGLWSAVPYTNSTKVHCAEKVSCLTCHGYGKPYDASLVVTISGHEDLINQTANYPRMYHGDICMGCHEAKVHVFGSTTSGGGTCKYCHSWGDINVNIYSEPDGRDYASP